MIEVEICVEAASASDARAVAGAVKAGGGSRVELCADMRHDGLSPSWQSIRAAREGLGERARGEGSPGAPGLMVMARPRGGDFCYTMIELWHLLQQVERAARWGADGVVLGMLEEGRSGMRIASRILAPVIKRAQELGLQVTFHRAFDAVADPDMALEQLVDLGVQRVLTAGISWGMPGTALEGLPRLRRTLERAGDRMEVIVAGGVRPQVVPALLAGLAGVPGQFSLHAYSGAQVDGVTTAQGVQALVAAVRMGEGA